MLLLFPDAIATPSSLLAALPRRQRDAAARCSSSTPSLLACSLLSALPHRLLADLQDVLHQPPQAEPEEVHLKYEPYINKPIEMYEELVVICGDDQATESFARGVTDPIIELDDTSRNVGLEDMAETTPLVRSVESLSTSSNQVKGGKKKRREFDSKIDLLANKIGESASAISKSRNRDISMELYAEVMKCDGYDESKLVEAFDYLLGNDVQARSFLTRSATLRQKWLMDFFERQFS